MKWKFWESKTFWISVVGAVIGIIDFISGDITSMELKYLFIAVIGAVFMRNGIEKSGGY